MGFDFSSIKDLFDKKPRTSNLTGSEFGNLNINNKGNTRDDNALKEILSNNIPDFLFDFKPIYVENLIYLVMPDYLSIGNNSDFLRIPMSAPNCKKAADYFNCIIPTRKMVNDIYHQAVNKLNASPNGPPYYDMDLTIKYINHNNRINKNQIDFSQLTAGHKKDIVISKNLSPNKNKRVGIYGWFNNNTPIQQLNTSSHDLYYQDYSQCVRLIYNQCIIDGQITLLTDILNDNKYSHLISDEGSYSYDFIY